MKIKTSTGRYWNHKFYGRPGNWSIYQDGERVQISDSEKSILDWYIKRLIDFESKVVIVTGKQIGRAHV